MEFAAVPFVTLKYKVTDVSPPRCRLRVELRLALRLNLFDLRDATILYLKVRHKK
jgi:hypothetical protein